MQSSGSNLEEKMVSSHCFTSTFYLFTFLPFYLFTFLPFYLFTFLPFYLLPYFTTRGDASAGSEPWLSKKRHYEMFTDRNGRPCQASDDRFVAAMFRLIPKSLEETVMFANEDEGFQELFDRRCSRSK